MTRIRKAVIPAAGLGTRFYPLTRAQPKEMLPLVDKPVIHYVVEEAVNSGLDEILIIVGAGKDAIINYFDNSILDKQTDNSLLDSFPEIFFVRQRQQLGLADSIRYAKKFVDDEPFVVLLGDTVYMSSDNLRVTEQMINVYNKKGSSVIALEQVPIEEVVNYGIASGKADSEGIFRIDQLLEKPSPLEAPSNLGITGLYALEPEIFEFIEKIKPGKNGELQLTDALSVMAAESQLFGFEINGQRFDIGNMELWIQAFIKFVGMDRRYSKLFEKLHKD